MKKINRRDFARTGVAAGLALANSRTTLGGGLTILTQKSLKPVVIASDNGNQYKNGGDVTCVQKAFAMMAKGSDVLDALIAGVNILELDPEEVSVGYGGVPNADGVVQLDASCVHGPKKRAGAV
ncbi:MAG: isoaspartyl peptidase/L-asparaginase, partial [Pyrinomonadaceae bacterium]